MTTYKVFFSDVLGNENEGFEVNDRSGCGTIELPVDFSDHDLIQALIEADILGSFGGQVKDVFTIDGDESWISIDYKRNGKPFLQLEIAS
jgi:hypothetical protein